MKRRMVGAGGVILVIALLGIVGWYVFHTQSTQAELNRAISEYESRKPVDVSFVVAVPENTPKDQVLYLSGSVPALGNWDAAGVPLKRREDGRYVATIPQQLLNGMEYAFKVTRGTWGTVEADADGKDLANHAFTAAPGATVELKVQDWLDDGKAVPGKVTTTGNIVLHKNAIVSKPLGNTRSLIVYLPPDYEKNGGQRYPVLYLQDGQNLFDQSTSYQGIEWGVDETAQRLIAAGQMKPAIIVGVYNAETRKQEFTPPLGGVPADQAKGDAFARMMVEEVKPFIDQRYRTMTDRASTIIGGGSLGALTSLYTAKLHNDTFGQIVALSPWLRHENGKVIVDELIGDGKWLKNTRLLVDMGTDGGHNYPNGGANALPDAQLLLAALEKAGLQQGSDFVYREIEGDRHNEASWSASVEQVLLALFGSTPTPSTQPSVASESPTTAPAATQPI